MICFLSQGPKKSLKKNDDVSVELDCARNSTGQSQIAPAGDVCSSLTVTDSSERSLKVSLWFIKLLI